MKRSMSFCFRGHLYLFFLLLPYISLYSQVGIGNTNPNPDALLEIGDATTNTKGLLLPRVDLLATNNPSPLSANIQGMVVYNKNTVADVTPGYYYNDGSSWVRIATATVPSDDWTKLGNPGTSNTTHFLGTSDNMAMRIKTNSLDRFEISSGSTLANGGRLWAYADGTAASPIYSWSSDPNTGMYRNNPDILLFATAGSERLRLLANGQIAINNGGPIAGDRFTVNGTSDESVINGYATGGNGIGVYGENATTNGVGLYGNTAVGFGVIGASTGGGYGVVGDNTGTGRGVIGFSTSSGYGVQGQNDATGIGVFGASVGVGNGVIGQNTGTGRGAMGYNSANGTGIQGQVDGAGVGVFGTANHNSGFGGYIRNQGTNGVGLVASGSNAGLLSLSGTGATLNGSMGGVGFSTSATGTGIGGVGNNGSSITTLTTGSGVAGTGNSGVYAQSNAATGIGIVAVGNNSTNIVMPVNGAGIAASGTRLGVYGYAGLGSRVNGNRGNYGGQFILDTDNDITTNATNTGTRATAVLAGFDNIAAAGTGGSPPVLTAADSYFGGYFSGGNVNNATPSYAFVGLRHNTNAAGSSGTDYKIIGPGSVSTLINDAQGIPRIMYAPETPEILFQDYGTGKLVNGEARINIDPILKEAIFVDDKHPLKVFVTLEGECNGVYVTDKSADGFTVKELQGGTSNVPFSWQLVANRADTKDASGKVTSKHVGLRLPVGPGPLQSNAEKAETILLQAEQNNSILLKEATIMETSKKDLPKKRTNQNDSAMLSKEKSDTNSTMEKEN
ncbi:beta strand repeat-containing protein [Altibacter lentus]|uniref:beta strand repeat-containing protein n=1 Tax=Altibacter lentus TaxID=1223410 RepID=UPI001268F639|nr:hypothetical protein [Altibacter lentus]